MFHLIDTLIGIIMTNNIHVQLGCAFSRLGKSLKPTIIASFSYNSFKRLANWSLEDMFFGNTFKSLRVAPPPFYNTHENVRLMSTVSYILSAPSRFWGRKHYFCRFYSID